MVIFEENRSFDNFFGEFPGANGLANAGDKAIQIGPDGKPYKFLPAAINYQPQAAGRRQTLPRATAEPGRSRSTAMCRSMMIPAT